VGVLRAGRGYLGKLDKCFGSLAVYSDINNKTYYWEKYIEIVGNLVVGGKRWGRNYQCIFCEG